VLNLVNLNFYTAKTVNFITGKERFQDTNILVGANKATVRFTKIKCLTETISFRLVFYIPPNNIRNSLENRLKLKTMIEMGYWYVVTCMHMCCIIQIV